MNLVKYLNVICMGIMVLMLNGCIIPIPHTTESCGPICGYVLSEHNKPLVACVEVFYSDGDKKTTDTNSAGYFSIPSKRQFQWGIIFGVALNHSFPYPDYYTPFTNINITADGYETLIVHHEVSGGDIENGMCTKNSNCQKIYVPIIKIQ